MRLLKIVSGGQTGVDRAALDAAMAAHLPVGGWCPRGRLAEDGAIPEHYPLDETPSRIYRQRTEWNVRDSDGTLILYWGELQDGTLATVRLARDTYRRPLLIVNLLEPVAPDHVRQWLDRHEVKTLNIAGPRESSRLGIYRMAYDFLDKLFRDL